MVNDDRRVAAEFQGNPLAPDTTFQIPADGRTAGKREQLDALVLDERRGVARAARHHGDGFTGPTGLDQDASEFQRRHGRLSRGPDDDGIAGGQSRRHLVRHQIEREVERSDAGHRTERHVADVRFAPLQSRQPVERDDLADDALGFLGRDLEYERRAIDFDTRDLDRLAGLERDRLRQVLAARRDARADAFEDLGALPRGQRARHAKGGVGVGNGALDFSRSRAMHQGDERSVEGTADLADVTGANLAPADETSELAESSRT